MKKRGCQNLDILFFCTIFLKMLCYGLFFFAISSKIGKRHLRIRRWIGKQREGVFMIPLWIWIIAVLLVVGIAVAVLLSSYENKRLAVEYYEIESEKIPEAFDGYRIVFLTDLHCAQFGENNQELIERIDECRPDMILVGGDMVISRESSNEEVPLALMKELSAKYPIYYADGNHELKLARNEEIFGVRYKDYVHSLKEYNIHHISNETIVIQSETGFISLTAFDLEKKYYQRFHVPRMPLSHMESVVGSSPGNIFHILLAHNPNYLKTYADWGSDLVLAGHFHGGMVRIPKFGGVISPQFQIFPKYDAGEFHEGETTMILSRGLGNHSIKLRLFNKPEISCIELKKRD